METEAMHKEKLLAPKLRFKGFNNEWKPKHIGSILTIGSGRDYKHLSSGNIPVFGTGGLMTMVDKFLYDGATVCIGRKGTIDKPMYFEGKLWTVDTLFYTHLFLESTPKFVYNLFQKINWKEYNEASGVPSLSKATIEKIKVSIPSLSEQQKIASFLSAVDEKIKQLARKKELLEQYKKGVMQQLFGGKLRFKNESGNEFPKWERKKLDEISERVSVGLATTVTEYYTEKSSDAIPIIRNLNIKNGYFDDADMLYLKPSFSKLHSNKRVKKGDVITVHTGSNVGLTCVVPDAYDMAQTFTTLIVTPSPKILQAEFLNQLLSSPYGSYQAQRLVVGGGKGNLNTNDFKIYPVNLPCYQEQIKISTCLSSIDKKIEIVNKQIDQTQNFKKGLLQQMFV